MGPTSRTHAGEDAAIETRVPLGEIVEHLSRPEAFGSEEPVQVVQTHASVVFLVGPHVYKVKKPVRLWGLIDYGTFEARRHFCEEEVRINRRLAPEVYRGVVRIVRRRGRLVVSETGTALEHAVWMVRLPPGSSLEDRIASGETGLESEVERVGETLAEFHLANRLPPEEARLALPAAFGRVLRQNFRGTAAGVPSLFSARLHDALEGGLARRLRAAASAIRRRVAAGRMVEGHGDVRLEHVVRHRGRVAIIDAVEFTPVLRRIDPLSDLAFLSMELLGRGRRDLAETLERAYFVRAPDDDAASLRPLYRAYRAHVRAKVDHQVTLDEGIDPAVRAQRAAGARRHLVLAWTCARERRTPPLVLMRGLPGTGKSVLATRLAPLFQAEVLRSDVVRKGLAGLAPTERPEGERKEALYASGMSGRTYAALLARGEEAIASGRAAILDATYMHRSSRREAAAKARALGAPFAIVDVRCPPEVVRARLERRAEEGGDASDADWQVYLEQAPKAESLTNEEEAFAVPYDAGEEPEAAATRLAERIEEQDPTSPRAAPAGRA